MSVWDKIDEWFDKKNKPTPQKPKINKWAIIGINHLFSSKNRETETFENPTTLIVYMNKETMETKEVSVRGHMDKTTIIRAFEDGSLENEYT